MLVPDYADQMQRPVRHALRMQPHLETRGWKPAMWQPWCRDLGYWLLGSGLTNVSFKNVTGLQLCVCLLKARVLVRAHSLSLIELTMLMSCDCTLHKHCR